MYCDGYIMIQDLVIRSHTNLISTTNVFPRKLFWNPGRLVTRSGILDTGYCSLSLKDSRVSWISDFWNCIYFHFFLSRWDIFVCYYFGMCYILLKRTNLEYESLASITRCWVKFEVWLAISEKCICASLGEHLGSLKINQVEYLNREPLILTYE